MPDPKLVAELVEAFEGIPVVDAHEHLPPERDRVASRVDVFTLFGHYTKLDQLTAGMSQQDHDRLFDRDVPLEERWRTFAPILENIRHGAYSRPAFIAAKEFYGFDDVNDDTYAPLSETMAEQNQPGIYDKVLVQKCGIVAALTQQGRTDYDLPYMIPVMPIDTYAAPNSWGAISQRAEQLGESVRTLDEYIEVARKGLQQWKTERVVGLKMGSRAYEIPDRAQAQELFEDVRADEQKSLPDMNPLRDYLLDCLLKIAAEEGLVVAVHTGMWGDFRTLDIHHMLPIIQRHPETRFDIYHAGMPRVREAGVVAKNFANVWMNLCWCHIISPVMTRSLLDEWIDMVPVNKIIGFGGDYCDPVEKTYGHLVMAREDIAHVLARRVEEGLMDRDDAAVLARKWFYENPKGLYGLDV